MAAPETYFLRGHDLAEIAVPGVRVERRPARTPDGKPAAGLYNAWIWLDNPAQYNSYTTEMVKGVILAFRAASNARDVSSVVFTGAGPVFSSGGNVKDMQRFLADEHTPAAIAQEYRHGIQQLALAVYQLEVPVIAAVNGPAIGAGCDLACMCDIRLAADTASFAESFVRLGLIPGDGGAWLLPRVVGRSHSADNLGDYHRRIEAVNFALSHDDGISTRDLGEADIVLVGVSRSGKTPTCLYMALQYGIRTANYPLVAEDFQRNALPPQLHNLRRKLYGLTIQPERLQVVRNERRPGSRYSTLANCQFEVRAAEALMRQEGVPYIDTSRKSIEEIAATILHDTRLVRHVY